MKEFEPKAKCPKCGYDRIGVAYHDGRNIAIWGCPGCHPVSSGKEHLCRICRQCGYLWAEAVLSKHGKEEGDRGKT